VKPATAGLIRNSFPFLTLTFAPFSFRPI